MDCNLPNQTMNLTHHRDKILACSTRELLKKDVISDLQDDILIYISEFLTLKEAGMTSVLSKRWRHIWAYKRTLNFSSSELHKEFERGNKSPSVEGPKYLRWVDQVVESCKTSTIHSFQVRFNICLLGESCSNSIDKWFRFAMEKKVQRLTIHLAGYYCTEDWGFSCHPFPSLNLCNSLKYLMLSCVNITGEVLESFIRICKTLISLTVIYSDSLECLRVSGPSLNLKILKIYDCAKIKQLEISAPKLVTFTYIGRKINVQFKGTPKLDKLVLGGKYARDLINICSDVSSCCSRIKLLCLHPKRPYRRCNLSIAGSVFTTLERLDLVATPRWYQDLYCFMPLIKACPLLHHLILVVDTGLLNFNKKRELRKWEACPLKSLKIVEVLGFVGNAIDLEFAEHLMECAVSLDKIILDTGTPPSSWRPPCELEEEEVTEERKQAMQRAELLRANCKPSTEFEIR